MIPEFSIEVFAPKTVKAAFALSETTEVLVPYAPQFMSVTCGTGNGSPDLTSQTLTALQNQTTTPLAAHIACGPYTMPELEHRADCHLAQGIKRAIAIRGDDGGTAKVTVTDLVAMLTAKGFEVCVGAYPETHPFAKSEAACLEALKAKQSAGATSAITQFFFDADTFLSFRDKALAFGITLDLIPGILPVTNWKAVERMAATCGTHIASDLAEGFARAAREDRSALMATAHAAELSDRLVTNGVDHLHFYSMNKAAPVVSVLQALGQQPDIILREVA